MEIFINETSLEGQYHNQEEFTQGIKVFISIFSYLKKLKRIQLFKDELLVYESAIKDEVFQASFDKIRDKSLKIAFRGIVLNKLNPINWRTEQVHSLDNAYFFIEENHFEDVTGKTLAEIAERNNQSNENRRLAINFINSRFQTFKVIPIYKNDDNHPPIPVDCCDNKDCVELWVGNTSITANDFLRDTNRFRPTSKISTQGTKIYQEIETNFYWHFDNFHNYISFEVYNRQGMHLGVANIQGEIDFEQAVDGRSISDIL